MATQSLNVFPFAKVSSRPYDSYQVYEDKTDDIDENTKEAAQSDRTVEWTEQPEDISFLVGDRRADSARLDPGGAMAISQLTRDDYVALMVMATLRHNKHGMAYQEFENNKDFGSWGPNLVASALARLAQAGMVLIVDSVYFTATTFGLDSLVSLEQRLGVEV